MRVSAPAPAPTTSPPVSPAPPGPAAADVLRRLEEAQALVAQLQRQLEHYDRLATLGTLAATLAHEFNNILTPATNYAQFAIRALDQAGGSPDLELVRKSLAKCQAAGEKADKLCQAILGFARAQPETPGEASCDVSAAIEAALLTLGREQQKDGIRLRCQVPEGLAVRVDPLQLEHVLVNLLVNARQAILAGASKRHGTLGIAAVREQGREGPLVRIDVTDTGCGIEPERLAHIFEPFYTSRGAGAGSGAARGTGLGLSLCRQIVERHGGQIQVESTPGRGSAFHVRLPAA